MTRDFDLLVIGDVNADLVLRGEDPVPVFGQVEKLVDFGLLTVGGSASITACGTSRLGLRTACIGVLGEDALGSFMRSELRERGVDTSSCVCDPGGRTGITVVLATPGTADRAIITALGTAGALTAARVSRDLVGRSRHLHCSGYFLQPLLQVGLEGLFREARSLGLTCSLDPNWDPSGTWDHGLAGVLDQCDLFFPNQAEALRISGADDLDAALDRLGRGPATVAVKMGAQGACVRQGPRTLRASAPHTEVVDSTGAGDSFAAGYLSGFINGWDAERCLSLAVACGSLSTRGVGGVDRQPALAEAVALASTIGVSID